MQDEEPLRKLAETALEFVEFPLDADVYQFIGTKLLGMLDAPVVSVCSYDYRSGLLRVRALLGLSAVEAAGVSAALGAPLDALSFPDVDPEIQSKLFSGRLIRLDDGLYEAMFQQIPQEACRQIEAAFGIRSVWSIGFRRQGKLFGNVTVLQRGEEAINQDLIEAFINQVSIVIENRQAVEDLQEARRYAERIIDSSLDVILTVKADGTIVFANKKLKEMLGYVPSQIEGTKLVSLVPEDSRSELERRWSEINGGNQGGFETDALRADGSTIRGVSLSLPARGPGREPGHPPRHHAPEAGRRGARPGGEAGVGRGTRRRDRP